jgi:hypothetical protein
LKPVSNGVVGIGTTAKSAVHKVRRLNSRVSALAYEAKKSGGFQQVFGPLGDILDVDSSKQKTTQEEENRVSLWTRIGKSYSSTL